MIKRLPIATIRAWLRQGREFAFLDVREESAHSRSQPLFAVNLPLGRMAERALGLLPRASVPIVLFDNGEGLIDRAAAHLVQLGYRDIAQVDGGLAAWRAAGGELFRDVGVPSKAFGEWLEDKAHTPSLAAPELKHLIESGADVAVLDCRPFSEYRVMTIPGAVNCPGADLVARAAAAQTSPETLLVVNCAGRTRSLLGAQSLINSGLFKRVAALRNGTIGWLLAGFDLEVGAGRVLARPPANPAVRAAARSLAVRAGVRFMDKTAMDHWERERATHSLFQFDVRQPEETARTHAPGFQPAPGGQLVQATDEFVGVRGARILLGDDDGIRAAMTASWLRQMGWDEVGVVEAGLDMVDGPAPPLPLAVAPLVPTVSPQDLRAWLADGQACVIDLARSSDYAKGHIPGAWFAIRSRLAEAVPALPRAPNWVLTSPNGLAAAYAHAEMQALTARHVFVLAGGTQHWGGELEVGLTQMAVPADDVYKRPYEGTDAPRAAMQAYLDWEFGLVEQIAHDGTARYQVLIPENP